MVDTRGDRPRLLAGASSSWLGPQVLALRRPRRDLAGDARTARSGSPRTPTRPSSGSGSWCPGAEDGVVYAGTEPGAVLRSDRRRRDVRPRARRCGTTRTARSGAPASAARPSTRVLPHPTDPQSVTAALSTGGVYQTTDGGASWEPRNQGIRAEFLPEGQQYPEFGQCVHKVTRHPCRARAALPAEPRRRLPLRRRGRRPGSRSPTGCPPTSGSRSWCTRTSRTPSSSFPINGGDAPLPAGRQGPGLALARRRARPGRRSATACRTRSSSAVMRDAMCADEHDPAGLYFGAPQRRRLGLRRRGRDLARGGRATCPT